MESYSYQPSYPDSGDSSPRSREIEFDNPPPWEDPLNPQPSSAASAYRVKLMCSYGGKINPRPHDNQLSYVGGETKILVVDRAIKFSALLGKLSGLCDNDSVSFKYQLPGEDLDALISVTNDEDLENMFQEYDRLSKASPKPARMRLFLFTASSGSSSTSSQPPLPSAVGSRSFGSDDTVKSDKERFVEALNSGPAQAPPPLSAVSPPPIPPGNVDFLFGLEKEMAPPPPPSQPMQAGVVVRRVKDSQQLPTDPLVHEHEIPGQGLDDKLAGSDPIQKHIQDLQRLRIEAQQQQQQQQQQQILYQKKIDDNLTGGFPVATGGEFYVQKLPEKAPPLSVSATVSVQPATGYWPQEKQVPGGVYPGSEPPLYMIQTPAGPYHHAPMVRPVTGPTGQGYYTLQRMPPEQQVPYSVISSMAPVPAPAPAPAAAYADGYGVMRPGESGGYAQVAYDGGMGRQVYYTAQVGGPQAQAQSAGAQYHHQATIAAGLSGDVKALNQDAVKVVGKPTQA